MPKLPLELAKWLENFHQTLNDLKANGFVPTPTNTRQGLADLTRSLVTDIPDMAWIRDDGIDTASHRIPVRIYHPVPEFRLPVLVYFHGGGHMAGSVAVYDPICRKMALATRHIVVSVDYRLAPEHPYPAALEDAYTAVKRMWPLLARHNLAYREHLSIAGDSGGGAMCATVAHRAQHDSKVGIRHQMLIYPSLDYTLRQPSITANGCGYLLEKEKIKWYFDHYFQHREDRKKASPLYMEVTSRMPRTLVITAEFDPLRDEGTAYVQRLKSKGVHCERLHLDNMIHAFLNMENLTQSACRMAYAKMGRFLAVS